MPAKFWQSLPSQLKWAESEAIDAMTMNVSLSPQLEAMVKDKLASGRYTSASEVVREALRLMEQRDQLSAMRLQQLQQDIQDGLASGEPMPSSV
jgi:antitoxin ParD1/3/4